MSRSPYKFSSVRVDDDESGKNVAPYATVVAKNESGAPAEIYFAELGGSPVSSFLLDANGEKQIWAIPGVYSFSVGGGPFFSVLIAPKSSVIIDAEKALGAWDASANTPTLASGVGVDGSYYEVSVAGNTTLDGYTGWLVGDKVIFNGASWSKIPANGQNYINNFSALASTQATAGKIVYLREYNSGSGKGGGMLQAKSGAITPNNVTTFASATANVYFERMNICTNAFPIELSGALGNNSLDNSPAINRAITYIKGIGGGTILFESGVYRHSANILCDEDNVFFLGAGGRPIHDAGSPTITFTGTLLFYIGAAGATQLSFVSPIGSTAQKKRGGGIKGFWMDGNNSAVVGLNVKSWNSGHFEDLYFQSHTGDEIKINTLDAGDPFAEAKDTQNNKFVNIVANAAGSANGWNLDGISSANPSFNIFERCTSRHVNGGGFILGNTDNNLFIQCSAARFSGTGLSLEFKGADGVTNGHSRSNHFIQYSSNNAPVSRGVGFAFPATNNSISYVDSDNGTPDPIIEAGSFLSWNKDSGVYINSGLVNSTFASSFAGMTEARNARTTQTMVIQNGSSNHVTLMQGTNSWGIHLDGSGDLRFLRSGGTGILNLGNGTDVKIGSRRWTFVTSVPTTGTWAQGDRAFNIAPVVGSPKGWICTVAGTPGTWVSEGNL